MGTAAVATVSGGLKLDAVKAKLVDASIERAGIHVPRGTRLANKVGLLQAHYQKSVQDPGELCECDGCCGVSPMSEDACPYCGLGQVEVGKKPEQKLVKKTTRNPKPSTEIVKQPEPKTEPSEVVTVDEAAEIQKLDQQVHDVVVLVAGADATQWLLGRKIQEVEEGKAWRLRKDDHGKPAYRSFGQFCVAEFELSASQCYRLVDVAKAFTEDQVREIGTTKLTTVLKLPESDRAAFVERIVKESMPNSVVVREVKKLSPGRRDTGRQQTPPGTPGANRLLPEGTIATGAVPGTRTLQFFCMPKKPGTLESELKPAHTLDDNPFLSIDLLNGVQITVQVIRGSTGLVGKVVIRKSDALED
jgi:hypothetical protein